MIMMQEIKERRKKRQYHLEALKSKRNDLTLPVRLCALIDGRIWEVENEIGWLTVLEEGT